MLAQNEDRISIVRTSSIDKKACVKQACAIKQLFCHKDGQFLVMCGLASLCLLHQGNDLTEKVQCPNFMSMCVTTTKRFSTKVSNGICFPSQTAFPKRKGWRLSVLPVQKIVGRVPCSVPYPFLG